MVGVNPTFMLKGIFQNKFSTKLVIYSKNDDFSYFFVET